MHAKKRMEEALEFALERAFGKDVNANVSLIPLPKIKSRKFAQYFQTLNILLLLRVEKVE